MLVWGGTTVEGRASQPVTVCFNDGGRFDPATGQWKPIASSGAPAERASHTTVWTGEEMLVWSGANAKSECLNTGGRYDPTTGRWRPLTVENAPAPRYMMRTDNGIWTGQQFLVFGGFDLNSEFGIGHAWSPAPTMHLYQRRP